MHIHLLFAVFGALMAAFAPQHWYRWLDSDHWLRWKWKHYTDSSVGWTRKKGREEILGDGEHLYQPPITKLLIGF